MITPNRVLLLILFICISHGEYANPVCEKVIDISYDPNPFQNRYNLNVLIKYFSFVNVYNTEMENLLMNAFIENSPSYKNIIEEKITQTLSRCFVFLHPSCEDAIKFYDESEILVHDIEELANFFQFIVDKTGYDYKKVDLIKLLRFHSREELNAEIMKSLDKCCINQFFLIKETEKEKIKQNQTYLANSKLPEIIKTFTPVVDTKSNPKNWQESFQKNWTETCLKTFLLYDVHKNLDAKSYYMENCMSITNQNQPQVFDKLYKMYIRDGKMRICRDVSNTYIGEEHYDVKSPRIIRFFQRFNLIPPDQYNINSILKQEIPMHLSKDEFHTTFQSYMHHKIIQHCFDENLNLSVENKIFRIEIAKNIYNYFIKFMNNQEMIDWLLSMVNKYGLKKAFVEKTTFHVPGFHMLAKYFIYNHGQQNFKDLDETHWLFTVAFCPFQSQKDKLMNLEFVFYIHKMKNNRGKFIVNLMPNNYGLSTKDKEDLNNSNVFVGKVEFDVIDFNERKFQKRTSFDARRIEDDVYNFIFRSKNMKEIEKYNSHYTVPQDTFKINNKEFQYYSQQENLVNNSIKRSDDIHYKDMIIYQNSRKKHRVGGTGVYSSNYTTYATQDKKKESWDNIYKNKIQNNFKNNHYQKSNNFKKHYQLKTKEKYFDKN